MLPVLAQSSEKYLLAEKVTLIVEVEGNAVLENTAEKIPYANPTVPLDNDSDNSDVESCCDMINVPYMHENGYSGQ